MNIKHVMTPNLSYCMPGDPSTRAARIMKDKNVGIVPIIESDVDHKLIGVVTDRDLCLAVVAQNVQPDTVKVQQCMTTFIVTVRPDDDVQKAMTLMSENQVRRIPVVNQEGMLEGMVATADILQRANVSSDETQDVFKKVTQPTDQASKPRGKMTQKASLMWGILALVGVLPAFAAFFGAFNGLLVSFAVVAAIVSTIVTWVT